MGRIFCVLVNAVMKSNKNDPQLETTEASSETLVEQVVFAWVTILFVCVAAYVTIEGSRPLREFY